MAFGEHHFELATGMPPLFKSAVPFEGPVLVAIYIFTAILTLAVIATRSAFTNGFARLLPGPYHVPISFHLPKLLPLGLLIFWFIRVRFTRWHQK